ncbi:MAG: aminoacetone oxidase family FAD-binding enzyme, partial [Candidatus Omnitrophica bacterium]|nr:aminoacetone oxidase family FAD-binding enzyme [Candidatus Omnitrophota bacterium]
GKQGKFLRTAFFNFSNQDLTDFFQSHGLNLKTERQGRVFPVTDKAASVVEILQETLLKKKIKILYNTRLKQLKIINKNIEKNETFRLKSAKIFQLCFDNKDEINAAKVILTTGGASYSITGSCGGCFEIAQNSGHTIIPLSPALVPLRTNRKWVKDLQGLTLKNVRITFEYSDKENDSNDNIDVEIKKKSKKNKTNKIISSIGEVLFTHFGISGPLVLDLSNEIVPLLEHKKVRALIDLKPGLTTEKLEQRLLKDFKAKGKSQLKNVLKELLPQRLILVFIKLLKLDASLQVSQITREQRAFMVKLLKALPLTISGSLELDKGMVTSGGISIKEINARTMESKIMPGLYFAGEIIDGSAPSGGYNLQQAFSTGFLAGEGALNA